MKTVFATIAVAVAAGAAFGQISSINSWKVEERIFNDLPGSTLTTTNNWAGGNLRFDEQFPFPTPGGFANKHVGYFSNDNGATRYAFQNNDGFRLDFNVSITAPAGQPRKEAGIDVRNPRDNGAWTDEGQVLIASDGEVAVFGAAMPYTGQGAWLNAYTLGTTAHVSFEYIVPGGIHPTLGAYRLIFTDAVTGIHDSGYKIWGAGEFDGTTGWNAGTQIGLKAQNQRFPLAADSSDINYTNVSMIPAPGVASLLGLSGLMVARRRQR